MPQTRQPLVLGSVQLRIRAVGLKPRPQQSGRERPSFSGLSSCAGGLNFRDVLNAGHPEYEGAPPGGGQRLGLTLSGLLGSASDLWATRTTTAQLDQHRFSAAPQDGVAVSGQEALHLINHGPCRLRLCGTSERHKTRLRLFIWAAGPACPEVMGLYPGDPGPPGADMAGTVLDLAEHTGDHLRRVPLSVSLSLSLSLSLFVGEAGRGRLRRGTGMPQQLLPGASAAYREHLRRSHSFAAFADTPKP